MAETKMSRLILTLTLIGLLSALILTFVYEWTIPKINQHQEKAKMEAINQVLPGIESDDIKEVNKNELTFYEGYSSGIIQGVALIVNGGGFQGEIKLVVGANPVGGEIYGIQILEHQETPGLGANIETDNFLNNFKEKPFFTEGKRYKVVKRPVSNKMEVEAIAGATISSEKVTNIVEEAVKSIQQEYGGGA